VVMIESCGLRWTGVDYASSNVDIHAFTQSYLLNLCNEPETMIDIEELTITTTDGIIHATNKITFYLTK
jgi:hypothetical protein